MDMKRLLFCLMAMMGVLTLSAQTSIYDFHRDYPLAMR